MARSVVVNEMRLRCGLGLLAAACVLLTGCKQVAIYSVNDCINRQCKTEQGKAHQQCMTSCQRQYGP